MTSPRLPLPAEDEPWAAAADALRAYAAATAACPGADVTAAVDAYADAAAAAYRSPPEVVAWWRDRLDAAIGYLHTL